MKNRNFFIRLTVKGLLLLSLILVGFFIICPPINSVAKKTEPKTVRVGWYNSDFNQIDEYGRRSGYAYEYQQKLTNYADWEYEYVEGGWSELFEMLKAGEIDLLSDVTKTEEREEEMLFSLLPMGTEDYYIFVDEDNESIIPDDYSTFSGKKIGVNADSYQKSLLMRWAIRNHVDAQIIDLYGTRTDSLQKLSLGIIDAFTTIDMGYSMDGINPVLHIGSSDYYFAVNSERSDLLADLDYAMEKIREEDRYFNQSLYTKYFNLTGNSMYFSADEKEWLESHKKIRIGYIDNYLPYCDKDSETGELIGTLRECLDYAEGNMKNGNVEFVPIAYETIQEMIDAMGRGEINCAFPLSLSVYDGETYGITVTDELLSSELCFVYKQVKGRPIKTENISFAVPEGNTNSVTFMLDNFPSAEITFYDTTEDCAKAVLDGRADCFILSKYRVDAFLDEYSSMNLAYYEIGKHMLMTVGVAKSDHTLYSIMSKIVNSVPVSIVNSSLITYSMRQKDYTVWDFIKDNLAVFFISALLFVIIVATLLWRGRMAKIRAEESERITDAVNEELEKKTKEIENRVLRERIRLQTISEAIHGGFKIGKLDHDFSLVYVSDQLANMLGYTVEEFMRASNGNMRSITNVEDALTDFPKALEIANAGEMYTLNYRVRCKDNSLKSVEERGRIIQIEGSEPEVWSFLVDKDEITEKVKALEAANQANWELERAKDELEIARYEAEAARADAEIANEAKTNFLFNMSHDIRTPMNAIVGYSELIKRNIDNREKVLEYQDKLQTSSDFLLSLINGVLDMARIESGKISLEEEYHETGHLYTELIEIFANEIEKKNLVVTVRENVQVKYVFVDVVKNREILANLFGNAIKYTPEGGEIKVTATQVDSDKDGYVKIITTVEDNGIGMSEEFLPHIFEPFTRENNTTSSKVAGTGLGLPIVKALVEALGGTISVESKIGVGTKFTVVLYHRLDAEGLRKEEQNRKLISDDIFVGKRALLVEDVEINAEIAINLLEDTGLLVDHASNGEICVEMISSAPANYYDIILMDIQMPILNGYEATKIIREMDDEIKSHIPIVAMTANAFDEDRRNAMKYGMNGHISKPIQVKRMKEVLASVLA